MHVEAYSTVQSCIRVLKNYIRISTRKSTLLKLFKNSFHNFLQGTIITQVNQYSSVAGKCQPIALNHKAY